MITDQKLLMVNVGTFTTYTGKKVDIMNPSVDQIDIKDIARGLSHICRYGGQIGDFYSVGQHILLCSLIYKYFFNFCDEQYLRVIHHDSEEAYLGDVPRPIKYIPEIYLVLSDIAKRFEDVIYEKFYCWQPEEDVVVKKVDRISLAIEHSGYVRNNEEYVKKILADIGIENDLFYKFLSEEDGEITRIFSLSMDEVYDELVGIFS